MKKGFYLILILLFPSIIYMLFSLGEHHVKRLDFYGPCEVEESGDTTYLPVEFPKLKAADGEMLVPEYWHGKAVIIDLFHLPCDDDCAKHFTTLANYLNDLEEKDKWVVVSICLDSVSDSSLFEMQHKLFYEGDNWYIAQAADFDSKGRFLSEVFLENDRVKSLSELPSNEFVLFDQRGRIREFFDSRIYKENKKMEDAVKMVLQDPHMAWKTE